MNINSFIEEHIEVFKLLVEKNEMINTIALKCIESLENGGKIIFCGNGGSAADAQHIAAELTGRYKVARKGLAGVAVTTDTSALTAIGNDFGYDQVFARQVEAIANTGDVLIGFSTSGNSENVINAIITAKEMGCYCVGLTGRDGGKMNDCCDINLVVPSSNTPRIQECHIFIGHTICEFIDERFSGVA